MNLTRLFVGLGVVLGFGLGVLLMWLARPPDPDGAPDVADASAVEKPAQRPTPPRSAHGPTRSCTDVEEQRDSCYAALAASWANTSHPIEVADPESSYDAARRFSEAYFVEDEPEEVESKLRSTAALDHLADAVAAHDLAIEEVVVDCDRLPCVMELDLAYTVDSEGNGELPRPSLEDIEAAVDEVVGTDLDGYHAVGGSTQWNGDRGEGTYRALVTTHSDEELEGLEESMMLFATVVFGLDRVE